MRKWFILLIVLAMLVPTSVQAQGSVTFKSFHVRLWSEYDQPSMLAILDFALADDAPVPSSVEIRVPSNANITAVAYDSGGSLVNATYQMEPDEDANWQVVKLMVNERTTYHIEYYQPLERDGNKRSFTYLWAGDYAVSDLGIEIELPKDSTSIKTTPTIPFVQSQSFMSGGASMSGFKEGQSYLLQLDYSRTSDSLAQPPSGEIEPVTSVDENTDGRSTLDNLPLFLGGFGVALILVTGIYFLRGQTSTTREHKPRKRRSREQETDSQTYCHECGTRAHEGDRFCRTCGSKLRVS